ncbi:MAG: hypothetical protein GOV00_01740 [Candidatus Altiarchaeota archaeon]|nr:hypothetical protein [Candidatus Altiarchaeota archaeon]
MKAVSEVLKVNLLSHGPTYKSLGIDEIVAVSGLQTFKKGTLDTFIEDNPEIDKKRISQIHKQSTKRGHASMTTTPNFYFEAEGSRIIDHYGTTLPFGSYVFFSSRRIEVTEDTLVRPDNLPEKLWKSHKGLLSEYHKMWGQGKKDRARKLLPIGFYSHGIIKYSLEDILQIIEDSKKKHMPSEVKLLAERTAEAVKEKAPSLYEAAIERPVSLSYGHPDLFHKTHYRQFGDTEGSLETWTSKHLEDEITNFKNQKVKDPEQWKEFALRANDMIMVNAVFPLSISIWNDIKRHRTTLQKVESIYFAMDRAFDELNSLNKGEVPEWIHIPPGCGEEYISVVHQALEEYQKLTDSFDEKDAVYVAPQCVKVMTSVSMNGYHLLDPFGLFGVRLCTTADYSLSKAVKRVGEKIVEELPVLEDLIGPKCKTAFCPERVPCGVVERYKQQIE